MRDAEGRKDLERRTGGQRTAAGGAGGLGSECNYLDGPGEGEGGRSGDGGHVLQTGGEGEREERGGGGHEERESDGEVAGRCWVGWRWSSAGL